MFKRVERRRKRKAEEEELGIDEDLKDVMGLNDTDSSESDSPTEASDSEDDGEGSLAASEDDAEASQFEHDSEDDADDRRSDGDTVPAVSIASALREPVQRLPAEPDSQICLLCPGKRFKQSAAVHDHVNSKVHQRRWKRARELSMQFDPDEDLGVLISHMQGATKPDKSTQQSSKRAEKRRAKLQVVIEKRKRHKEMKIKALLKKAEKSKVTMDQAAAQDPMTKCSADNKKPVGIRTNQHQGLIDSDTAKQSDSKQITSSLKSDSFKETEKRKKAKDGAASTSRDRNESQSSQNAGHQRKKRKKVVVDDTGANLPKARRQRTSDGKRDSPQGRKRLKSRRS